MIVDVPNRHLDMLYKTIGPGKALFSIEKYRAQLFKANDSLVTITLKL